MSDPVLKPCPHCGGEASYESVSGTVDATRWSVGCSTEGCHGYQAMLTHQRRVDAAKAWNQRAPAEQEPQ